MNHEDFLANPEHLRQLKQIATMREHLRRAALREEAIVKLCAVNREERRSLRKRARS